MRRQSTARSGAIVELQHDLTVLTMKLRHGVTFHDGTKFDAAAVARNLERSAALGNNAGASTVETMSQIAAVETEGDDTVRIRLKAPVGSCHICLAFRPA